MIVFVLAVLVPVALLSLAAGTIWVRESCGGCPARPRFTGTGRPPPAVARLTPHA
jgi:hypothetical protein